MAVTAVALLLIQIIPGPVTLAEVNSSASVTPNLVRPALAKPEITLEEAIRIVKTNFNVPSEYTDFNSGYNNYEDREVWSLRWNGSNGKQGEFAAEVNAATADILNMNYWKSEEQSNNIGATSAITKIGAQEIGANLLARLLGERAGQLRLIPSDDQIVLLGNHEPSNYSLHYQRLLNGLRFLGNGVNITVSAIDGHINSYNLNWSQVEAPEVKGVINLAQAQKAFEGAPFFKLHYWIPNPYRPLALGNKQEAKLIYQLTGQSGGAIDAFTGEPLQLEQGEWLATDEGGYGRMDSAKENMVGTMPQGTPVLTPQEQQEVQRTAKLLNQDEAIAAVQRWIGIPDNLTLRSANLSSDWQNIDKRIWSFDWNSTGSEGNEDKPQYLSARVNATTGELLGFNSPYQQSGKSEAKLDRIGAQKLAEDFLKRVQPDRLSQVVLDTENNLKGKEGSEPWTPQYFSYNRVANGVDFPGNGITVNVDPISGIVIGYELNWSVLDLPSLAGILTKDKAADSFLKARPLTLTYVRIYSKGSPGNLRLVYLPLVQDSSISISNIIDAKSGELLDFQGQPLKEGPKPYIFTDLKEVNGAQEIMALGQAGLFGDFGSSFKPLDKMSIASLLKAMYLCRFGVWGNTELTDEEIITKAKEQHWLKEDIQLTGEVNRELLAKVLLRYIQLDKVAELKNIYQLNFQDTTQISTDGLGYIAVASGTGILKVEGQEMLAPREVVNRAEAATALFRALSWRS